MKQLITIIQVLENGREVHNSLRDAVLESRSELCDILNGEGGAIEKYNELTDILLFDTADDDEYIDIYEMLVNHCWTKILNQKGYRYAIISEIMYDTKMNPILRMKGIDYITKIEIAKR